MKTLTGERYAPLTTTIGFVRLDLEEAGEAVAQWRRSLGRQVREEGLQQAFPEVLNRLQPLTGGARPRELLIKVRGGWTAYFDCSLRGTDAVSTCGYLSRTLGCDGVVVSVTPHTAGLPNVEGGRYGSVLFEMYGPKNDGHFLNYIRTIGVAYSGTNWVFTANGQEQPFERAEAYAARQVRQRFTSDMLEDYCKALGIDVFDERAYGPESVLVSTDEVVPDNGLVMSLAEAQKWLGITPGMADALAG